MEFYCFNQTHGGEGGGGLKIPIFTGRPLWMAPILLVENWSKHMLEPWGGSESLKMPLSKNPNKLTLSSRGNYIEIWRIILRSS